MSDWTVDEELLAEQHDLAVFGNTGYVSAPLAAELAATWVIRLLTVPRQNHAQQLLAAIPWLWNSWQVIETVDDQLRVTLPEHQSRPPIYWCMCPLCTKMTAQTS